MMIRNKPIVAVQIYLWNSDEGKKKKKGPFN